METLQSQVNKAAKKRLSLSGLEILQGRLSIYKQDCHARHALRVLRIPEDLIDKGYNGTDQGPTRRTGPLVSKAILDLANCQSNSIYISRYTTEATAAKLRF